MDRAVEEALNTGSSDVPIGCIIVCGGEVIASCHNKKEEDNDVTSHAEILALKEAQTVLCRRYLDNCDMYVTLEPCPMCAWAILQAGIKTLYFGSYNRQYGAFGSAIDLKLLAKSKIKVFGGIEEEKCDIILNDFFERLRNGNKNRT